MVLHGLDQRLHLRAEQAVVDHAHQLRRREVRRARRENLLVLLGRADLPGLVDQEHRVEVPEFPEVHAVDHHAAARLAGALVHRVNQPHVRDEAPQEHVGHAPVAAHHGGTNVGRNALGRLFRHPYLDIIHRLQDFRPGDPLALVRGQVVAPGGQAQGELPAGLAELVLGADREDVADDPLPLLAVRVPPDAHAEAGLAVADHDPGLGLGGPRPDLAQFRLRVGRVAGVRAVPPLGIECRVHRTTFFGDW